MAAGDIQAFIENISNYGVVQSDRFDVNIALPPIIASQQSNSQLAFINSFTNITPFRAISCSTPAAAFLTAETYKWGIGPRVKQATNVVFAPVEITFLADKDAVIESFCHYWMNLNMNYSFSSTNQGTFYTNLRKDPSTGVASPVVQIAKYDKTGNVYTTYVLTDCTPISFSPAPLSWDSTDDLVKFRLGLNYITYDIQ
jgi:hypothetical protein